MENGLARGVNLGTDIGVFGGDETNIVNGLANGLYNENRLYQENINLPIVKNGLVTYLDAGNPYSYSGTGTGLIWRDLSGYGNNGTLTNGPTFSSANGGSIVFSNIGTYVSQTLNTSSFSTDASICMFLKLDVALPTATDRTGIITLGSVTAGETASHYPWTNGLAYLNVFRSNRVNNIPLSSTIDRASPHMLSITTTPGTNGYKIYQNSSLIHQDTGENSINLSSKEIGRSDNNINFFYLNGNIYSVLVYNRTLSTTEITQNYNAVKSRFGL